MGEGGVSRPLEKGGGVLQKSFFRPLGPLFCLKIGGGGRPPGPSPGSATEVELGHSLILYRKLCFIIRGDPQKGLLHVFFVFTVTPSEIKKLCKPFNTESTEYEKCKKINIQKASPRIRSVRDFICEKFGKTFYPNL